MRHFLLPADEPSRRFDARRTNVTLAATIVLLATYNVTRTVVIDDVDTITNVATAVVVGALAWWAHLDAHDLGLEGARVGSGLRWGGAVAGIVLVVMALAALVPATRPLLDDDRVRVGTGDMLFEVLVTIPLGTVLLEELAFRGSLLGLLRRGRGELAAVLWCSLLFGLWHIAPAISTSGDNRTLADVTASPIGLAVSVAGTVVATGAAGVVFCWLRLRSASLVAPVLAHWAVNAVTFSVAWATYRWL